jgi:nitrile hydratase subunit beta
MNGVHDMGGMHGFGPILRDPNERGFHEEWEAHVVAINTLSRGQGLYNIDEFRYGIERMDPAEYLRSSYFERWLATVEHNLVEHGVLTSAEIDARVELLRDDPDAGPQRGDEPAPPPRQPQQSSEAPAGVAEPRYAVGERVVTRNQHPTHHTRLPRYARGKRGVIQRIHGPAIFPDTNAHGLGENPQVLYSVRFDGNELWGDSSEPGKQLYLDLWESYLTPASS